MMCIWDASITLAMNPAAELGKLSLFKTMHSSLWCDYFGTSTGHLPSVAWNCPQRGFVLTSEYTHLGTKVFESVPRLYTTPDVFCLSLSNSASGISLSCGQCYGTPGPPLRNLDNLSRKTPAEPFFYQACNHNCPGLLEKDPFSDSFLPENALIFKFLLSKTEFFTPISRKPRVHQKLNKFH